MAQSYEGPEQRQHSRVSKSFSLVYYPKGSPELKKGGTFVKDISKGGLRFRAAQSLEASTELIFEIGVPYMAPQRLIVEGVVIACDEKVPNLVYEVRIKFKANDDHTNQMLEVIEKGLPKDFKINKGL